MMRLVRERAAYGVILKGERYDIGNKLDFLKTNIAFGLNRPDIGRELKEFIKKTAAGF